MKLTDIRVGLILAMAMVSPGYAQDLTAHIVDQLTEQGFDVVVQERTMLGRVRISAERDGGRREIVLNPNTGEILRDLWQPAVGSAAVIEIIDDVDDLVDDDLVDDVDDVDDDVEDDDDDVDDDVESDDDSENDDDHDNSGSGGGDDGADDGGEDGGDDGGGEDGEG